MYCQHRTTIIERRLQVDHIEERDIQLTHPVFN
jgi:hypothetical protein